MKPKASIIIMLLMTNCSTTKQLSKEVTTQTGLRYTILKQGNGEVAKVGQKVGVYESMSYLYGKPFYSIEKPAETIKFTLGAKQVIAGVDEGVLGMKIGELRKLIIPPSLSKRSEYPDYLSSDSTLLYKIELVEIIKNK